MRKRTAIVTGAAGFIGAYLFKLLQSRGWNVVGVCATDNGSSVHTLTKVQFVQCDLRNGNQMTQLFKRYQPTHVFHLGGQSVPTVSWKDPVSTFESNIMGSLNLFEAVRHMERPPVVVSACSSAEYGHVRPSDVPIPEEYPLRPLHPYGISKVCLDLLAQAYFLKYKIPTVTLRLFNTTGPGKTNDAASDFVRQLVRVKEGLQPPVIAVGNLKPRRAFLDVNDAVRGFYLAATKGKPGETYNLCAARTHQVGQLLRMAIRMTGVKVTIQPAAHLMRSSEEKIIFGSTRKIRRDTGWKPLRSLEQTLGSMLKYWNQVA